MEWCSMSSVNMFFVRSCQLIMSDKITDRKVSPVVMYYNNNFWLASKLLFVEQRVICQSTSDHMLWRLKHNSRWQQLQHRRRDKMGFLGMFKFSYQIFCIALTD